MIPCQQFDHIKKGVWIENGVLYQLQNRLSNDDKSVSIDPDIVSLVLDLNRDRSAYTGLTSQGYFSVPDFSTLGRHFNTKRTLTFGRDGNLNLFFPNIGDSGDSFSDIYPDEDLESMLFSYTPPQLEIGIRDDEHGFAFYSALEEMKARAGSEISVQINERNMCIVTLASEETIAFARTRQYTYPEIVALNKVRLKYIADFHHVVTEIMKALPDGAPDWVTSSASIQIQRKGRIPSHILPGTIHYDLKSKPIIINIGVHHYTNGRIVIHHAGYAENAEGYRGKYSALGIFLVEKGVGAVVRLDNHERDCHPYEETVFDDLRAVIEYALKNSREICGSDDPTLYLMGFSGGATASAAVACEYSQVEKILLMGPGLPDLGKSYSTVSDGLSKFTGEVYIVQGEQDRVNDGHRFYSLTTAASSKNLVYIPHCDHHFRHETNDRIYSKAPLWAFLGDTSFPSPEGGIRLVGNHRALVQ